MKKDIILLDGATGTCLWDKAQKAGLKKEPVWTYNTTAPEIVLELEKEYVAAGTDILYTNTFGANRLAVEKADGFSVSETVSAALDIAHKAVDGTDVKIALDMGPLSELMEPYGDLEEDDVAEIYDEMIATAVTKGVDYIVYETFMDAEMLRVAVETANKYNIPVLCTMTFEEHGKTMMGNSVEDICDTLVPLGIKAIGINCSFGPTMAIEIVKKFAECTEIPIILKPNAGLPDPETGKSTYDASDYVREITPALETASYIGACCGSDPSFIFALKEKINN